VFDPLSGMAFSGVPPSLSPSDTVYPSYRLVDSLLLILLLRADYFVEQITVVIEDEKVSLDDLQDAVQEFEDYVQSTDIAAMQKL
jgi:hypothetical protein